MPGLLTKALACLSLTLAASPAMSLENAATARPPFEGVWRGTIGDVPIHACVAQSDYDTKGAYYYDRVRRLLRLVPGKSEGQWFEQETYDKNGASWQVSTNDSAVSGTWNDGKKQLPISLARVAGPKEDSPCGSMAFHLPRLAPVRLSSKHMSRNGAPYTKWTFKPGPWLDDEVEISTFTLDRAGSAIAKINALLRASLPKANGTGDWLDCIAGNVASSSMDGTWYDMIEPKIITDRWLAAQENSETNCGGPHPENINTPRTFDLLRGTEVDPLDWLGSGAVHREDFGGQGGVYKSLRPNFLAAMLKGWKGVDRDCDEAMRSQASWSVGVDRGALIFSPNFPRVIMACGEDFKVSFARLQPWLNGTGKAAVATLPH